MKLLIALTLSLAMLTLIISCKKVDDSEINGPSCLVSNSLPVKVEYTNARGFKVTREYKYDQQNRLIQVTNFDSIYTLDIVHMGDDTTVYSFRKPFEIYITQRVNNSWGERVETNQTYFSLAGDTLSSRLFLFSYNGSHEVRSIARYNYAYSNGKKYLSFADSSIYQWVDGNVVKVIGNVAYPNGILEYIPNTNGQFLYNSPAEAAGYLYDFIEKPVLSKNLIAKYTTNSGEVVTYTYTFGDYGRVKTIVHTGNSGYAGSYRFFYKCI